MTAADLCPRCLAENIVATIAGPTCKHQPDHDAKWFPLLWERMTEQERVDWIWANRGKTDK